MKKKTGDGGAYKVGYGKPPADKRFKQGQSGNPKGRPKGRFNVATLLDKALRALQEKVVINENGRRQVVTKLDVAVKQLVNKAASGDLAAFRMIFALQMLAEERASGTPSKPAIGEADKKIMCQLMKRLQQSMEVDDDDDVT